MTKSRRVLAAAAIVTCSAAILTIAVSVVQDATLVRVPDISDLSSDEAELRLRGMKLVGLPKPQGPPSMRRGYVVPGSQSPIPGTEVRPGTRIVYSTRENPVATFVREKMQPGSTAFVIPSPVRRGESVEAVLQVSPPTLSPDDLQRELEQASGRPSTGASGSTRVAFRMTAALATDRISNIVSKDQADQAIDVRQGATWRWTVTPTTSGPMRVTVTLSAPVTVDGHEAPYQVTSFERTVTVTVTLSDRGADMLTWTKDNWVVLAALGAALAAVFNWLHVRSTRKRQAGFRP